MKNVVFFDIETDRQGEKVYEIGGVNGQEGVFRSKEVEKFTDFLKNTEYLCGHNIFDHDLKYVKSAILQSPVRKFIDTLYLSPLLFPEKPYHSIGKQYKIRGDEFNDPVEDSRLARKLFLAEIDEFKKLDGKLKSIYFALLRDKKEFRDFLKYVNYSSDEDCVWNIKTYFYEKICANADISKYILEYPVELAYSLALINTGDKSSIMPPWIQRHYPIVENIIYKLRSKRCIEGCKYCEDKISPLRALKEYFKYDSFKTYEGEPLQEQAVEAGIDGKSLLAVFPTGGGKSLAFQLPALIQGEAVRGLTLVISPLQSLMKDQVDSLEIKNITSSATINSSLDPIERAKTYERVMDGSISILYVAPESLRAKSIERLLLERNVVRFVIDEAHCFSTWGQDFRVDYLYIGDFIKKYQEKKNLQHSIPVSCFTATARLRVIEDIQDYFKKKLSLQLELFKSGAQRTNLRYFVSNKNSDEEKYQKLRELLSIHDRPAIVYVSRRARAFNVSNRLNLDGIIGGSVHYHGGMEREERIENQEKFMSGEVRVIVATTAFGMGVDKDDVGIVIHYDISASLEDYVQEAGRAGRRENISAECYVLFDEEDLNKHFMLLNQTKLSINEIKQVWSAIKEITRNRPEVLKSALEIAREAGWDENTRDMENRVTSAIATLEQAKLMTRGQNAPSIFGNSILVKNMEEATNRINSSAKFSSDVERQHAIRIMKSLISAKQRAKGHDEVGESRVDYLADILGLQKEVVLKVINVLREEGIIADVKDLLAYIRRSRRVNSSLVILSEYSEMEKAMIEYLKESEKRLDLKEMNDALEGKISGASVKKLKTLFNFYNINHLIKRAQSGIKDVIIVKTNYAKKELLERYERRQELARFIIKYLFEKSVFVKGEDEDEVEVEFSCLELKREYETGDLLGNTTSFEEIDETLYYLTSIGALKLEGAFLLIYNAMQIKRLSKDLKVVYKKENYKLLEAFYENRMQQIHIVGEYAKRMADNYSAALEFVVDYFNMDYALFLRKYFTGRLEEIRKNITPRKYNQLFGELSKSQLDIIEDAKSKYIVVAAGPGSGKTKVLVHKLASLYMLEDVKQEQMLMLTFSRAAATEFKKKLMHPSMLGGRASSIQIKTFHSYCFDLLEQKGTLEYSSEIIDEAVRQIQMKAIENSKITKTVLVIDEAQDMSESEFSLVSALMEANEEMRIIAVGDDDQNIYEFRKSDSKYLRALIEDYDAKKYELLENYRSKKNIIALANAFVSKITSRLKKSLIKAVQTENGEVVITKHESSSLSIPVVNDLLNKYKSLNGSVCVLTETNDDAATIAWLLAKNKISAILIQDNLGFNILNLVEIRYFVDCLKLSDDVHIINEEIWNEGKSKVEAMFKESIAYEYVKNLIDDFESTNTSIKYKTDFLEYIYESKLEDFCRTQSLTVVVSTIHKAKGREFDNVFLTFKNDAITDEKKRAIYVAMTRAKDNLYIHCKANCFDKMRVEGVVKILDENEYEEPKEIVVPISFTGVHLDSFRYYSKEINKLKSGDWLQVKLETINYRDGSKAQKYFCYSKAGQKVVRFSDATCTKIAEQIDKGYTLKSARVRLIVWWQKAEDDGKKYQETKIVLPDIYFVKPEDGGKRA